MKKIIILFAFTLLTILNLNAQREIDSLTYENTQDIEFFKNIKNRTLVKKYRTIKRGTGSIFCMSSSSSGALWELSVGLP